MILSLPASAAVWPRRVRRRPWPPTRRRSGDHHPSTARTPLAYGPRCACNPASANNPLSMVDMYVSFSARWCRANGVPVPPIISTVVASSGTAVVIRLRHRERWHGDQRDEHHDQEARSTFTSVPSHRHTPVPRPFLPSGLGGGLLARAPRLASLRTRPLSGQRVDDSPHGPSPLGRSPKVGRSDRT